MISEDGNLASIWKLGGFKGWLPAEAHNVKAKFSTQMDLYALSLIFGYSLNKGCHPFGEDTDKRIVRIKESQPMILTLNQITNVPNLEQVLPLINRMLSSEPSQRPSASDVLEDVFFKSTATIARDIVVPPPSESGISLLQFCHFICFRKQDFNDSFLS